MDFYVLKCAPIIFQKMNPMKRALIIAPVATSICVKILDSVVTGQISP